jgi:hypothetical protein
LTDPTPGDGQAETYTVEATHTNQIQDPAINSSGTCTDPDGECYDLWIGAVSSEPTTVIIEGETVPEEATADFSFSLTQWNPHWAIVHGPPISIQISSIEGHDVNAIDPLTIRLNGTVPIIPGSDEIINGVLEAQVECSETVRSLGSVVPGTKVFTTIQGGFTSGSDVFSAQCPVDILHPIDIKPGNFPNSINKGAKGTLPVAILSTADFDATTVDPTTVKLEDTSVALNRRGEPRASTKDVNRDGLLDLVVHFKIRDLPFTVVDTMAVLDGETFDGTPISGTDTIRLVP